MRKKREPLIPSFFQRKTKTVAKRLLGKILLHRTEKGPTAGKIIETEAYYGQEDPASRASQGKTKISQTMWDKPSTILIYVVHGYCLFNIVTEEKGKPGAVLIRALEPVRGIELMKKRRGKKDIHDLCSGPGKLTQALDIPKAYNNCNLSEVEDLLLTQGTDEEFEVGTSHRIGVSEDLPEELRFYIKGSSFLSR